MREGVRVDAEGYHCFVLDEAKHDAFVVLERLMKAAGAPADTEESKRRFEAMMRERAQREANERRSR